MKNLSQSIAAYYLKILFNCFNNDIKELDRQLRTEYLSDIYKVDDFLYKEIVIKYPKLESVHLKSLKENQ
jgi:ribosomal protein S6